MTQQSPSYLPPEPPLPTSGMAIASLVTGILGFMGPVFFSVIAIITGYVARKETRSVPPRAGGDELTTIGIIMGFFQVGVVALILCVLCVLFALGIGIWGIQGR
jgi:hypothetical protein